ncbi:MAG: hypothetical protein JNM25_18915 [Planctomycetes bacterium]|nr:hypothetical protein [Planctomycetota bacterium]
MHSPTRSRAQILGLAVFSLFAASATAQSMMLTKGQVVAQPGDTPIGLAVGESFGTATPFDFPVMSREGNILFRGRMVGASTTTLNDRALFIGRTKADLSVLVRANDPAPTGTFPNSVMVRLLTTTGLPVSSDIFNSPPRISPQGNRVLFHAQLYDGGNPGLDGLIHTTAAGTINDGVIFTGTPGALQVLAQQATTTMPGGAALSFTTTNFTQVATSLNSSGTVTFRSNLLGGDVSGTTNDTAWIIGTPGSLSYFLRENDLVLGGANGIGPGGLGSVCILNEAGDVLHDQTLSTSLGSSPATAANDKIAFLTLAGSGVHSQLMREGDLAPDSAGTPIPGVFYGQPLNLKLGPSATASFHSIMTGGVTTANDAAIFSGSLGNVKMLARKGDVVPGTGGATIGVITNNSVYSENHGVLFGLTMVVAGGVTINNDSALAIVKPSSSMNVIAREGDPCPGLPGYVFGIVTGTYNFGPSGAHQFNDRGQVLFQMFVRDPINSVQMLAVYSWDPVLGLQLQLMAGDTLGGGTVTTPGIPIGEVSNDGNGLAFNESGDFCARSVTSTGQFIARGHVGSLHGIPSAVPVAGGVPQNFDIDCTPAQASRLYFLLATGLGFEPGFVSPFGGQTVPLNPDPIWTDLSLNNPNSIVWPGSLGFLDAFGKNTLGPAAFLMPPGFPVFLGTTLHHAAVIVDISMGIATTFVTEPVPCYLY